MIWTMFRLVVYGLGVWASNELADGYWGVGPVFGAVVLLWAWKRTGREPLRSAVFVAASTLIYAFVYYVSGLKWGSDSKLFEYFIGPFPAAIVAGSFLLPLAHTFIFEKSADRSLRTGFVLTFFFYLVTVLGYANEEFNIGPDIPWLPIMIAVWQGAYLWLLTPRSPER
ncbi:MAG TPA: hypothetical protein VL404_06675 [Candidatus Eisenbacteria bacterium]|nr:hypothetical protein [Candidatus Eisenbacteria bacterium]